MLLSVQNFARYLSFKRDNNELLMFLLRQLLHEQTAYLRSKFGGADHEPAVVPERDLLERVTNFIHFFLLLALSCELNWRLVFMPVHLRC